MRFYSAISMRCCSFAPAVPPSICCSYFLDWGLPPLILYVLISALGYRERFIPLIVSYNWLSVIMVLITMLPGALMTTQLLPPQLSILLMLGIYGFAMWVAYRLYSFVLECPPFTALGLAILMVIIGIASAFWLHSVSQATFSA